MKASTTTAAIQESIINELVLDAGAERWQQLYVDIEIESVGGQRAADYRALAVRASGPVRFSLSLETVDEFERLHRESEPRWLACTLRMTADRFRFDFRYSGPSRLAGDAEAISKSDWPLDPL